MEIKQYNIYEMDLTKTIKDDELPENIIKAVILSPEEMNDVLQTVVIAPLTSCENNTITPTTFKIDEKTKIRLDQISSLSKTRIIKHLGEVGISAIPKIKATLNEMLVK